MKNLFRRIEDILVAVTFAEAGEFERAQQVITKEEIGEGKKPKVCKTNSEWLRDVK